MPRLFYRRPPSDFHARARADRIERARLLDRLADAELQHGHHQYAEHLAGRAEALRQSGIEQRTAR